MAVARLTRTRKVLLWGLLLTLCLAAVNTILSGPGHMQSCVGGICVKIWRGADLDGPPISPLGIWTARHVQTQRSPGNISNDEGPEIREDEPKKTGLLHPVDIGFDPGVRDHSRNTVNEHLETAKPKHSPDGVTRVLLVTYMRGGSSVLGEAFNHNPDAFYWFEPLDGLYSDLYGTMHGWMPIDILYHKNKTMRLKPDYERQAVVETLKRMYNCDISSLPLDVTTNRNFLSLVQRKVAPFVECIRMGSLHPDGSLLRAIEQDLPEKNKMSRKLSYFCKRALSGLTSKHFEGDKQYACHKDLHPLGGDGSSYSLSALAARLALDQTRPNNEVERLRLDSSTVRDKASALAKHEACMLESYKQCQPCFHLLQEACSSSPIMVSKAIRLESDLVEDVIDAIPDLKVIWYTRDPRGIISSRKSFGLTAGLSNKSMETESVVLCQKMRKDIKRMRELRQKFPNRIHFLRYEDLSTDVMTVLREIYDFVKIPLSKSLKKTFSNLFLSEKNTGGFGTARKNSTRTAYKWHKLLKPEVKDFITDQCEDVLRELKYDL